jgi:hypothetical protein
VSGSAESLGAQEAGRYLAELLKCEPYRSLWNRPDYMTRHRESELHHTAVASVVAEYLQIHPREGRPRDRDALPSNLVPLVSKALNGVSLGTETLQVFISAFKINTEHAARLWRVHSDANTARLVSVLSAVPLDTIAALPARRHRTHSVHDHHYLDAHGVPYRHETLQVIEATVDGLDRYAYAFDTDTLTVEVLTGGTLGQPYSVPNGVHAVDILFGQPLALGQRHTIKYETTFRYQTPQEPHFKRMVTVHVEYADVTITFHRAKLPKEVWEAEWKTLDSEPAIGNAVLLDTYQTVSRQLKEVENIGYGFAWRW